MAEQQATMAGGCFWCTEAVFQDLRGVESVKSGYSGGHVVNPTYEEVCGKGTGHAEVIQVTFDPAAISFREILEVFFTVHDPTTPNRQGADVGPQYRSAIFYHSPEQKETAEEVISEINEARIWDAPVVTQVAPLTEFYPAEDYHQDYFAREGDNNPYCVAVVAPKLQKFRKSHAARLKRQAPAV